MAAPDALRGMDASGPVSVTVDFLHSLRACVMEHRAPKELKALFCFSLSSWTPSDSISTLPNAHSLLGMRRTLVYVMNTYLCQGLGD